MHFLCKIVIYIYIYKMVQEGIPDPSERAVTKALTKDELAKHCRRRTRGTQQTIKLIEELLLSLSHATDSLGVPLLKEEMKVIWVEQQRHIKCLQDPPGILLYTVIGRLQKGGVTLPVFRCARGTISLESFHLHLARSVHINRKQLLCLFVCLKHSIAIYRECIPINQSVTTLQGGGSESKYPPMNPRGTACMFL